GNGTVSGGGSSKPNPDGGGSDGDQGENPLG
ncbi:UNVERIFIED_CONTAM: DNA-binding protein, partial [Prevotella sp. 15_C9]